MWVFFIQVHTKLLFGLLEHGELQCTCTSDITGVYLTFDNQFEARL